MKIEEAALTGESVPVTKHDQVLTAENGKDVPLGDRKNMVYMGSTVVYGRGRCCHHGYGYEDRDGQDRGCAGTGRRQVRRRCSVSWRS